MDTGNNQTNISNSNINLNNVNNNTTNSTTNPSNNTPPQLPLIINNNPNPIPIQHQQSMSMSSVPSNTCIPLQTNTNTHTPPQLPIKTSLNPIINPLAQFSNSKTKTISINNINNNNNQPPQRPPLPPPPSLDTNTNTNTNTNNNINKDTIKPNNQNLFESLYNTQHSHLQTPQTLGLIRNNNNNNNNISNISPSPNGNINSNNISNIINKTPSYGHNHSGHNHSGHNNHISTSDNKPLSLRRGRPKKTSHSHRKAFEAGHPRFERALQQLIEMRQKHPQGLLPSIRGFMQTIHMGFANTNAVVKYYANNYLNMTLDDFKRDYMVIRRVRAKTRNNTGGRPKKLSTKLKYDDKTTSDSDSDYNNRHRGGIRSAPHSHDRHNRNRTRHNNNSNNNRNINSYSKNKNILGITQQQQQQFQQQLLLNQFTNGNSGNGNGIDFNFPLFFEGIANGNGSLLNDNQMPKLIADIKTGNDIEMTDGVKLEHHLQSNKNRLDFNANEFITSLESDLSVLMELQDNNQNNSVSPEDIKKPLSVVRKRLLTMLDRSLYHQLNHQQKVTIAKANLIAGICTAAIHTGYCKDALALYRQSLTLFRELNTDAINNGYDNNNNDTSSDNNNNKDSIDPFIESLICNANHNKSDAGKYSMFIVVIYYQMSLLYDKSLIEKVQKSRYYLIQALNLLVKENAMNSNKYCIETLQRLALFALETGKDEEYINMMLITLTILKKYNENICKILDVEIHFAKNLLSYGHQLPNTNDSENRKRFEIVKNEYQKLLVQIITDAKEENKSINTDTRRTLSKLLELSKFLLSYNQLAESYKVYHCMRKMCDDTQINLDLDFMKIWLTFVREFIGSIVKQNTQTSPNSNSNNNNNSKKVLWSEQILELCEFDVKVLEKIQQTTDINIGTDIYKEYILCSNALITININFDKTIIQRCKTYLNKAVNSPNNEVKNNAQNVLNNVTQKENELNNTNSTSASDNN